MKHRLKYLKTINELYRETYLSAANKTNDPHKKKSFRDKADYQLLLDFQNALSNGSSCIDFIYDNNIDESDYIELITNLFNNIKDFKGLARSIFEEKFKFDDSNVNEQYIIFLLMCYTKGIINNTEFINITEISQQYKSASESDPEDYTNGRILYPIDWSDTDSYISKLYENPVDVNVNDWDTYYYGYDETISNITLNEENTKIIENYCIERGYVPESDDYYNIYDFIDYDDGCDELKGTITDLYNQLSQDSNYSAYYDSYTNQLLKEDGFVSFIYNNEGCFVIFDINTIKSNISSVSDAEEYCRYDTDFDIDNYIYYYVDNYQRRKINMDGIDSSGYVSDVDFNSELTERLKDL